MRRTTSKSLATHILLWKQSQTWNVQSHMFLSQGHDGILRQCINSKEYETILTNAHVSTGTQRVSGHKIIQ